MSALDITTEDQDYNRRAALSRIIDPATGRYVVGRLTRQEQLTHEQAAVFYREVVDELNSQQGRDEKTALSVLVQGLHVKLCTPDVWETKRPAAPVRTLVRPFMELANTATLPDRQLSGGLCSHDRRRDRLARSRVEHATRHDGANLRD